MKLEARPAWSVAVEYLHGIDAETLFDKRLAELFACGGVVDGNLNAEPFLERQIDHFRIAEPQFDGRTRIAGGTLALIHLQAAPRQRPAKELPGQGRLATVVQLATVLNFQVFAARPQPEGFDQFGSAGE
jgi:hypothetical protein